MKRPLLLIPCLVFMLAACGKDTSPEQSVTATTDSTNPFFAPSDLPFGMPPFDRIRNEHYVPAFERGMAEESREIDAIAANPQAATFDNTIVAMERSGQMLSRTRRVFDAMSSANTNDRLKEIETQMAPRFAAHHDSIMLNQKLFERINALYQKRADLRLDPESSRLLDRYFNDFVRAGAQLSAEKKTRLRAINAKLADLRTAYEQNVLNEVNDLAVVVRTRDELAGLSESEIESAANEAEQRGLKGQYVLTLRNTTQQPVLTELQNRDLRRRIQETSASRGSRGNDYDNRDITIQVLALRAERAALLGYANHAAYILADQTAGTVEAVNDMLGRLGPRAVANARREAADLQALIDSTESKPFKLAAWDWLYYSNILRRQRYDFDADQLKPYFELDRVLHDGLFFAAERLYGLTFEERPDLPVYQNDVRVFEVIDNGAPLGLFIFDPYARESKRGGAWMNAYVSQSKLLDTSPVVANHLNIVKPPEGQATLLTLEEANTMFHEFGHALHGLFSNINYPYFAGTSVPRDFVEYPSQFNEMWTTWPAVLANYAVHYKTGEPIPQELVERVIEAKKFNQGFDQTEYLAAAIVDQAWHQLTAAELPPAEQVADYEHQILVDSGMYFDLVPPRYSTPYFSHIMGGYSAGYYSYIWSQVLDADSGEWFREHGGLTRENGDHFRETLLSKGGSVDAMELYRNFRGSDPSIEPLLDRLGLH